MNVFFGIFGGGSWARKFCLKFKHEIQGVPRNMTVVLLE